MKKKPPAEQPPDANKIWFMGFPTWESVVVTLLVMYATYN